MTPTVVGRRTRRTDQRRAVRLLHLLASAAVVVVLVVLPPAMPDFGPSIATPLTTSTLVQLALLLLWIVCLLLALVLLRGAVFPTRVLRPPPLWAVRPAPRRSRRAPQLERRGEAPAPRLVLPQKPSDAAPTPVGRSGPVDAAADDDRRIVARVALLGPVEIEGVRRPRRATTVELLAYLALHEEGASRDQLLEAMWPNEDPRRTRPRLWQSVSEARRLLGDAFDREGDRYRLDRRRVDVDVDQLDQLLARLRVMPTVDVASRALALWRGQPLSDCDYAWADGHARQLEVTLSALALQTGRIRLDAHDAQGALQIAEQGLYTDRLNETFVRIALEAEAALGRREAVSKRYETLCHELEDQLGLVPERATRALYRQLLAQD